MVRWAQIESLLQVGVIAGECAVSLRCHTDPGARFGVLRVLDDLPASGQGYSYYEALDDVVSQLQRLVSLFQEIHAADPPDG